MFLLMENGKYKSVEYNVEVDPYDGEAIMSRHLFRGEQYNQADYEMYDKEQVIGAFGLRNMEQLMIGTDEYAESEIFNHTYMFMDIINQIKPATLRYFVYSKGFFGFVNSIRNGFAKIRKTLKG